MPTKLLYVPVQDGLPARIGRLDERANSGGRDARALQNLEAGTSRPKRYQTKMIFNPAQYFFVMNGSDFFRPVTVVVIQSVQSRKRYANRVL